MDIALTPPDGLREVTVLSPALGRRGDVTIFVPEAPDTVPLPLMVLLHGVYGSHWSWSRSGRAHQVLAEMVAVGLVPPMALAMPSDGLFGIGSGYVARDGADAERWIFEGDVAADPALARVELHPGCGSRLARTAGRRH